METKGFFIEIAENVPELNIVYTSRTFQLYEDEFDERFTFVGPAIDKDSQPEAEEPIPYNDMHETIVYIAMGTMLPRFAKKIYKRVIQAFKNEEVSVIMAIGDELDSSDLGEIPSNVHVYAKVPQVEVLEHANLFITHGGMNSVNEGIHSKVPMVVGPIVNDQPAIAEQITALNIGKQVDLKKAKAEDIREAAFEVLNDETILKNIEKVGQEMVDLKGNEAAVETILEYMEKE